MARRLAHAVRFDQAGRGCRADKRAGNCMQQMRQNRAISARTAYSTLRAAIRPIGFAAHVVGGVPNVGIGRSLRSMRHQLPRSGAVVYGRLARRRACGAAGSGGLPTSDSTTSGCAALPVPNAQPWWQVVLVASAPARDYTSAVTRCAAVADLQPCAACTPYHAGSRRRTRPNYLCRKQYPRPSGRPGTASSACIERRAICGKYRDPKPV